jgi:Fe-S-cluster containining protein
MATDDEGDIGDAIDALAEGTAMIQAAATGEVLEALPEDSVAEGAAMVAFLRLEGVLTEVTENEPEEMKVACVEGCAWCCYIGHAGISAPEAVALARHIEDDLDEETRVVVQARVEEAAERATLRTPMQRWRDREPCAFLDVDTRACRVYQARPLRCRGWNSVDASACEQSFERRRDDVDVPTNRVRFLLAASTEDGQARAFESSGRDHRRGEMAQSVQLAMAEPDLAVRWARGEPVFDDILTDDELV